MYYIYDSKMGLIGFNAENLVIWVKLRGIDEMPKGFDSEAALRLCREKAAATWDDGETVIDEVCLKRLLIQAALKK